MIDEALRLELATLVLMFYKKNHHLIIQNCIKFDENLSTINQQQSTKII